MATGIKKYQSRKREQDIIRYCCNKKQVKYNRSLSKALSESYISHEEFVSLNSVLKEYNETKANIKNPEYSVKYTI